MMVFNTTAFTVICILLFILLVIGVITLIVGTLWITVGLIRDLLKSLKGK